MLSNLGKMSYKFKYKFVNILVNTEFNDIY